jgi:hypothetical protein
MRQVEDYLADQQAIDAAEQARLLEYLADAAAAAPVAAPATDPVAALAQGIRLLAVPEDDEEELDTHSCADSGCVGEHLHSEGDYYGISPSYSPNHGQYYNYYEQPYIPATPEFD